MNSKGMSQILVLIVAAVVLMTVGLLLITGFGNVFGDFVPGLEEESCQAQLDNLCSQQDNTGTITDLPPTCDSSDIPSDTYQCG